MGLLSGGLLGGLFDKVAGVADKLIVDKDKKIEFQVNLERLKIEEAGKIEQRLHDEMMGQIGVNTEEAKNESLFVAGWRPAVGWIGAVGLGWSFILQPVMSWTAEVVFKYDGSYPALNVESLLSLLVGMLGFGGLRTYEKRMGVAQAPPEDGGTPKNILPALPPEEAPWAKL